MPVESVSCFYFCRYSNLLPKYEDNLCENEKLQKENETLKETLKQTEESHKKIYLALYQKGQAAAKLEAEEQVSCFYYTI